MVTKPRNNHGLSLFATDKRARDAHARSVAAVWLALLAWIMGGVALALAIVERMG